MEHVRPESIFLRTRASLLARMKGGRDDGAWVEFHALYWRAIYGYALRFGIAPADAEDVVQEVFIKLFRQLPTFTYNPARGRFLSLVKTITRTTTLDALRRQRARLEGRGVRTGEETLAEEGSVADARAVPAADPWEEEWEQARLAVALDRVKPRVSPVTFEAFQRFVLQDQPAAAVAAALQVTPNTVYLAKARVIEHLRAELVRIEASLG